MGAVPGFIGILIMSQELSKKLAEAVRLNMTAEQLARAVYNVLKTAASDEGQNPDVEVGIRAPGEPRHFADTTCWCVMWEAGPYEWAVDASFALIEASGKLTEPYYSFDLCFYPSEDKRVGS
jgi:hypothetical protein